MKKLFNKQTNKLHQKVQFNHGYLIFFIFFISLFSCQKNDNFDNLESKDFEETTKQVKVGEELNIPYTAKNMKKAFEQVLLHLDNKSIYSKNFLASKKGTFLKSASISNVTIIPSHYYYKFLPKDSIEYSRLINDTILSVTNIPMHLKIEETGDVYDDPDIVGDETGENYGWLYSVVPFDYSIPENIENQLLEDMYFAPELDEDEPLAKGEVSVVYSKNQTTNDLLTADNSGEIFEYLEMEALKLTDNLDEEELNILRFYLPNDKSGKLYTAVDAQKKGYKISDLILDYNSVLSYTNDNYKTGTKNNLHFRRRKWTPEGKITVEDDVLNMDMPVRGARVRVRKWGFLPIRKSYTDNDGNFKTRSTRTKRVKYSVLFYNQPRKFRIKANSIFTNAKYIDTKTHKRRGFYKKLTGGRERFYAQVHNAVYDYYDRAVNKFGLKKPNQSMLRISAKYHKSAGDHLDLNPFGNINFLIPHSEIRVGRIDSRGNALRSDRLYALVTHEMTHASHYRLDRSFFINFRGAGCSLQTIAESWAEGVETIVTNDRYLEYDPSYVATNAFRTWATDERRLYNSRRQNQIIEHESDEEYTPIVIDLIDDYNQRIEVSNTRPIDRVTGFTLRQIQQSLNNVRGAHSWKENLIEDHDVSSRSLIEELFNVYMYDNCK